MWLKITFRNKLQDMDLVHQYSLIVNLLINMDEFSPPILINLFGFFKP